MEEFVAAQEQTPLFPIGVTVSKICSHLYQVIANILPTSIPASSELTSLVDTWILGISILVQRRQRDWNSFLQYGGEWERLRSINSKSSRTWSPYVLTRVLSVDPNAYFEGQDHFISAWFESIIQPGLERQHSFTALLLNIDGKHTILANPLLAKDSSGMYEITSDALFEARPALIVRKIFQW
jgi:Mus7/MMS22 family